MKKYLVTLIALATLWSCQTDEQYEELNIDPKNPVEVSSDFLFTNASVELVDFLASPNVNTNISRFLSQYLTATTYLDEPNYNLVSRNIPQNQWGTLYREVIFDLQNAKDNVEAGLSTSEGELTEAENAARLAQIEVLEVYAWQILVDTYGNIPYGEAINAEENSLPAYDDAATIYADLIERVNAAAADLGGAQGFSNSDVIYGGDMEGWQKFANSLQLRMAMRVADADPSRSQQAADRAYSNGVFESNADNATLQYQGSAPNTNPLWVDLVQSGRSDYVAANTIVDAMNELDDPRRAVYFDDNQDEYIGGTYGSSSSFQTYTHIGPSFREATHPGILLDYAEVRFHLAEAAQRGGYAIDGSAEEHYEAAITASMEYWEIPQDEIDAYLDDGDVEYDEDNWREQIGTQFWIAMFDNPIEGWSVWRKFDAPELALPGNTGNPIPLRFTYPVNEQNLNEANYSEASSAIGGDEQTTPIFWDVENE